MLVKRVDISCAAISVQVLVLWLHYRGVSFKGCILMETHTVKSIAIERSIDLSSEWIYGKSPTTGQPHGHP